ncbi:xanthine dehydrogenase family protein molybdopterin-binding subunit [Verticiella sediminum]|uniref:Xanthine dehydrogenase family protein molybdopterin-binding subunit n=2 Tax=Verticiella sediminum TaxID=1247510 RepID=A0A556A9B1_9BURK|nr:xanthine dehydrogenase family protein molybdopterin-binding subunit [Verticiella sediminum]TSH89465.1 xanthine dehydrogenase family protein molybdopterin-binding subunit [Verticiella sediminum]
MAVGRDMARVDAPLKVSGRARYTVDHQFPGMVYAVPVPATVSRGRVQRLHTARARSMPGVLNVYTHENVRGKLFRVAKASGASIDENRPPLWDDEVRYYGQYIALVVADTLERAMAAANAVVAEYATQPHDVGDIDEGEGPVTVQSERGDAHAAYENAPVTLDHVYTTPTETHNPIELHATVAVYDGETYTLYETSQAVMNHRAVMAQMLGVESERVRVLTHYLGSGFGGKLWPWTHCALAAMAARDLHLPVRLEVSRKMMFHTVGHRPPTRQRIRLAADTGGRLVSLRQDYVVRTSRRDAYHENCGEATSYLYSTPNLRITWSHAARDVGAATSMRGPGAVPGLYAVESAMNELAERLGMDPLELRLRNEPGVNEAKGVPFSSRHLVECLRTGAQRFGWSRRDARPGSMRADDGEILGWGMASASWMAQRLPAQIGLMLCRDGRVRVSCAAQDIGTGTYTVLAQMVADALSIPVERIDIQLGDTRYPAGPVSGGSMLTGSLVPAVDDAMRGLRRRLFETAAQAGLPALGDAGPDGLVLSAGRVQAKAAPAAEGVPFEEVLVACGLAQLSANGKSGSSRKDPGADQRSIQSFGAHFVEVGWRPELARLRVRRVVTVIDAGRIVNPRTGRNQIEGAVVMGMGMALFEHTHYDERSGAPINSNLADYVMAVHADMPELDVVFLDHPDTALNSLGARGIGEIGLAGVAAAITDAVHHATGVRVRELPVHIEDLLEAGA